MNNQFFSVEDNFDFKDIKFGGKSIKNIKQSKIMAKEGSKFVKENFDVNKMVQGIEDLYSLLLGRI